MRAALSIAGALALAGWGVGHPAPASTSDASEASRATHSRRVETVTDITREIGCSPAPALVPGATAAATCGELTISTYSTTGRRMYATPMASVSGGTTVAGDLWLVRAGTTADATRVRDLIGGKQI